MLKHFAMETQCSCSAQKACLVDVLS